MDRDGNVLGPTIAKLRYQRGWRQDDLVARMQIKGYDITRDILANIETRRSPVNDHLIVGFCHVFAVCVQDLFPATLGIGGPRPVCGTGIAAELVPRHR